MFKVRFNLGRGKNFKKWKITSPTKNYYYFDPTEVILIMKNARLFNNESTSRNIFDGANKRVCAWVECEEIDVVLNTESSDNRAEEIRYNPRVSPNWEMNGENVDFKHFNALVTNINKVFQREDSHNWA